MITQLEYLNYKDEIYYDYEQKKIVYPHLEEIQEYNKALIVKYPFLLPRNVFTDEVPKDYDYTWTELDAMPDGWRKRFGEEMVEEISQALKECDFEDKYRIVQIKEKWGGLRWYDSGVPARSKIYDIIRKYENLSFKICVKCGDLATYQSLGWICPWCQSCVEDIKKDHIEAFRELTIEDYER